MCFGRPALAPVWIPAIVLADAGAVHRTDFLSAPESWLLN